MFKRTQNCPQEVMVGGAARLRGLCSNSRRAPISKPAMWQEAQRVMTSTLPVVP